MTEELREARFRFRDEQWARISYAETASVGPSVFLFGIKKGGSTLLAMPGLEVLRYEDIVYDKTRLVSALARTMGAEGLSAERMTEIARRQDVFPDTENKARHIRQVHPGNHLAKLRRQTIEQLNDMFSPILCKFNYMPRAGVPQ